MLGRNGSFVFSFLLVLVTAASAGAQESLEQEPALAGESPSPQGPPDEGGEPSTDGTERLGDEQARVEEQTETEPSRSSTDPHEEPGETYLFLGAFYRHTFTPKFVLNLFLDKATPANNPGTGLEFTYRKDNFDIVASVYWQRFAVNGPFRGSGDPDNDTEMIDSSLSTVMAGVSLLWSTPFNDIVALQYGFDFGIGTVLGDLNRTEAYPASGKGAKGGYAPCAGPGNPDASYCQGDGDYDKNEPRWTDGGDVPIVWLRAALPHLALRIKPIHQLMTRIDFGFDLFSGFFLGAAVAYGL